jgi:hypothetical protein
MNASYARSSSLFSAEAPLPPLPPPLLPPSPVSPPVPAPAWVLAASSISRICSSTESSSDIAFGLGLGLGFGFGFAPSFAPSRARREVSSSRSLSSPPSRGVLAVVSRVCGAVLVRAVASRSPIGALTIPCALRNASPSGRAAACSPMPPDGVPDIALPSSRLASDALHR